VWFVAAVVILASNSKQVTCNKNSLSIGLLKLVVMNIYTPIKKLVHLFRHYWLFETKMSKKADIIGLKATKKKIVSSYA
jgi:hypothetical protein